MIGKSGIVKTFSPPGNHCQNMRDLVGMRFGGPLRIDQVPDSVLNYRLLVQAEEGSYGRAHSVEMSCMMQPSWLLCFTRLSDASSVIKIV
jgi:hypothetical protein